MFWRAHRHVRLFTVADCTSMKTYKFPHNAKDKERILLWTPDQLLPFCACFVLGIVTEQLTLMAFVGLLASWAYTRYSAGKPDGYLMHIAYWIGLFAPKGRGFINPYHRRILPK